MPGPRGFSDLVESPPFIPVKQVPLPVAQAGGQLFELGVEVAIGDEDVEPAVVVAVEEGGAEAEERPHDAVEPGAGGGVGEEPAAVVAVEGVDVLREIGHEEVEVAVVVVVAAVHTHAGLGACRPR